VAEVEEYKCEAPSSNTCTTKKWRGSGWEKGGEIMNQKLHLQ
jgi:hypothetical protein